MIRRALLRRVIVVVAMIAVLVIAATVAFQANLVQGNLTTLTQLKDRIPKGLALMAVGWFVLTILDHNQTPRA